MITSMRLPAATRGFTLLEILVAISIIAVLSSILYMSFGDARDDARNRALMAEVKEVQLAIELYRAQNGSYPPIPSCGTGITIQVATDSGCGGSGSYINGLIPEFITELPRASASANGNCDIEYRRPIDGSWYKLSADECLAGDLTLTTDDEMALCPDNCTNDGSGQPCEPNTAFGQSFAVYSLGGQCE